MSERIEKLLEELELEEKVELLAGSDMWHAPGVPRLGIPPFKMTDGPNGARGASFTGEQTAACLPCGSALAATWNPDLVRRVGALLGAEAKTKGAHVLLAPTVNIHRSPLAGRNFECYSEDPLLTARIAIGFIEGVQSQGVGCSIKHFVCNDSEFERRSISSEVGERALREIYLRPFELAIRQARPWSVMSSYNRINGTYACDHRPLLEGVLREEWGFDGFVVSDWWGTQSTLDALHAGLDLEMPGPPRHRGKTLLDAARAGDADLAAIDASLRRLLLLRERAGCFERPEEPEERSVDLPEHRAIAREAAVESIVLLKNQGAVLPLDRGTIGRLAVIGPNADVAYVHGGGSARVRPHYAVTPLEGIRAAAGPGTTVTYEPGCSNHRLLPVVDAKLLPGGFEVSFFDNPDLDGEPVAEARGTRLERSWSPAESPVQAERYSARFLARLRPGRSGRHLFDLTAIGRSRLLVDGELVIDSWSDFAPGEDFFGLGSAVRKGVVTLEAGREYELCVEYAKHTRVPTGGLRVGGAVELADDAMEAAESAAREADAAVVVVGLDPEWESEGKDRVDMELPGRQAELIERVAAANPRTVVALNVGSPLHMAWLDQVPALLQVWYPGQELGNALADLVFGEVSPSGRLPTTFPRRLEDNPAFLNYPGENGEVLYGEGIFVGYRYYDRKRVEPSFPFGHGLSYTRFEYGDLDLPSETVDPARGPVELSFELRNGGDVAALEVVQVYVRDVESSLARPEQELVAFAKVGLLPGESQRVSFALERAAFAFWDPAPGGWRVEDGVFEIRVGASSRDIRSRATLRVASG